MDLRKYATLTDALEWARRAAAGEYLAKFADWAPIEDDDGSRCGWDDADLAEIDRVLAARNLKIEANDRGLVAVATG